MRLTDNQTRIIKEATADIFGPDSRVWLFGSRTDDTRRGGDIDLYIETAATDQREIQEKRNRLWIRLQRQLGEQRIDISAHGTGQPLNAIQREARNNGIQL